jgi:phosphatidylserine/phosphatidylglycerophosphate/cardiolipin synthase-like enzyme
MSNFCLPPEPGRPLLLRALITAAALALSSFSGFLHPLEAGESAQIEAAFDKECETVLLNAVEGAQAEILAAVYSLTSRPIVAALNEAADRGVHVRLKYDARQAKFEAMEKALADLRKHKVKCQAITIQPEYAAMHHKFMVIDHRRVLTGSFNYTTAAATVNDENLVLIDSPSLADKFVDEFTSTKSR